MNLSDQLACYLGSLLLLLLVAILILWLWQREYPQKSEIKPDAQGEPSTPEKNKPAPAPVSSSRSYGWLWSFVLVFFGGLIALTIYHRVLVPSFNLPAPTPQATVPKINLQQPAAKRGLSLVGGDGIFNEEGYVGVQKGGRAFFATHTLPWFRDAVYHIIVKLKQKSTSEIFVKINGQWTKSLVHPGSPNFTNVVFFETGEVGSPSYFNASGINNIEVWSLGDDNMTIQCVSIEIFR